MSLNKISIRIGGPAGAGIFTIGLLLAKFFQRLNLNVVYTTDYPSLIKGGHNICNVRAEDEEITAEVLKHDVLIAMDSLTLKKDIQYLNKGGIIICSSTENFSNDNFFMIKLDFDKLLNGLSQRYKNSIAFGAIVGTISKREDKIGEAITNHFNKKSKDVIKENIITAKLGFKFAKELCIKNNTCFLERITEIKKQNETIFMSGNDAAAIGAIKAGVKFVGEYPMTPSSSFLSFMASHELDFDITTKHTEDELSAVNMVIGASIGGVRSMSATSGGGFSLMNEGIGFAGIAENPIVIFESQRTGPSTGIPTYTEQGDLKFVINCSQGEFPIVVMAPGDITECFYESFNAFNIAEITQTPVIVLLDKHISATHYTAKRFDTTKLKINRGKYISLSSTKLKNYKRYRFTTDSTSPRCVMGQDGGIHVNSSYEHDETGWTCEDGENHEMMQKKRFKKLELISNEILKPKIFGPKSADLTIIGWGSTKTSILEAIKYLNKDGFKVNYMHFIYITPMSTDVKEMLEKTNDTMILEGNFTAQLRDIIREKTGFYIQNTYLKYNGRPFYFEEIYKKIKNYMQGDKK